MISSVRTVRAVSTVPVTLVTCSMMRIKGAASVSMYEAEFHSALSYKIMEIFSVLLLNLKKKKILCHKYLQKKIEN